MENMTKYLMEQIFQYFYQRYQTNIFIANIYRWNPILKKTNIEFHLKTVRSIT